LDKTKYIKEIQELTRQLIRNMSFLDKTGASCCGTTLGQCNAIMEIGRAEEISLNELADLLKLDNSTMSRNINNMVEQQLVIRELDPMDRRYVKIKLTEEGWSIYRTIEWNMDMYYMSLLRDIPEEKHDQIMESLALLLEAMQNNKCC